ncbi:hypothetical protein IID20_01860 [Patescibacteria group bacterium]|nr:hypothetical protein [Patescibacteria group bacterium]
MLAQKEKQKIEEFFQALDKVSHDPGDLYDLGLIVSDRIKIKDLINSSSYFKKADVFNLSRQVHPDEFLKTLVKAFRNKKWLLVELIDGYLPARIYNQLRLLSIGNRLQIFNLAGEEEINLKMPSESRVVFFTTQSEVPKINNPNFLKLFGPIIKI